MVFEFSQLSEQNLNTVCLELNLLAHRVLRMSPLDFAIAEGRRSLERQEQLFKEGKSKTMNSKHLVGRAIDFVPFINGNADYTATQEALIIAGIFLGMAKNDNLDIRIGAIWDNSSFRENTFPDLWHIELI